MFKLVETSEFAKWLDGLRDKRAQVRIDARLRRLAEGNPGDAKSLGDGVSEIRIDYGPGYRVYYTIQGDLVIILLVGGDKSTQSKDIAIAKKLAGKAKREGTWL